MIQRTLACRACDSSRINTRMDGTYRCQDCGDVDEPIDRPSDTGSGTRYTVVRKNATTISNLPDPLGDDPWFRAGDHDISQSLIQKLWTSGLVWRKKEGPSGSAVRRWRLKPHIYEVAVGYAKSTATLPCGHAGVRNVIDGGYECSRCGEPCTRAEAKATLSGRTLHGGEQ